MKRSQEWFPRTNRGVIMAWWGTHLVVGEFVATNPAAFATQGDWLRAAWIPSQPQVADKPQPAEADDNETSSLLIPPNVLSEGFEQTNRSASDGSD